MAFTEEQYQSQVLADLGDKGSNAIFELFFPVEAQDGTWDFTFGGASAVGLDRFTSISTLTTSLESVPTIDTGNIQVSLGQRGYIIEFIGALAAMPQPTPEVNGDDLTGDGLSDPIIVEVSEKQAGKRPFLDIEKIWGRYDEVSNLSIRYLYARLAAAKELRGEVWTQINEQTGEKRREYQKQFDHIQEIISGTEAELANAISVTPTDYPGSSPFGASVKPLVNVTPNGEAYGQFARNTTTGRYS